MFCKPIGEAAYLPPLKRRVSCGFLYEEEARVVRQMYDWYIAGTDTGKPLGVALIAERLNRQGVPILQWKSGPRGRWHPSTVWSILTDETYVGTWHFYKTRAVKVHGKYRQMKRPRAEWLGVPVPAIVDSGTFAAAQGRTQLNSARSRDTPGRTYLFGHRIRCGLCHYAVVGNTRTRGDEARYYRCSHNHARYGANRCSMRPASEQVLRLLVWSWLTDLVNDQERVRRALNERAEQDADRVVPLRAHLQDIARQRSDVDRQLKRLVEVYTANADLPMEWFSEQKERLTKLGADLEDEQGEIAARLAEQAFTLDRVQRLVAFCAQLRVTMDRATPEQMRQIFETLQLKLEISIEQHEKVVAATCVLGSTKLPC